MDNLDELEYQDEDGAVLTINDDPDEPRRLLGFCRSLQEACELYHEFARIRAWSLTGVPRT